MTERHKSQRTDDDGRGGGFGKRVTTTIPASRWHQIILAPQEDWGARVLCTGRTHKGDIGDHNLGCIDFAKNIAREI